MSQASDTLRRLLDASIAAVGLVALSPLLVAIAVAVRIDSPGPVVFRQERVGRGRRPFFIHKFRTMTHRPSTQGPEITASRDVRITRVGRLLRRAKLDELLQLWDVLRGEMSLVGPRPEVPKYVALYSNDDARAVFAVRPGITDPVSLILRDEQGLLSNVSDPEAYYIAVLMPAKLRVVRRYLETRSLRTDLAIVCQTLLALTGRRIDGSRWCDSPDLRTFTQSRMPFTPAAIVERDQF